MAAASHPASHQRVWESFDTAYTGAEGAIDDRGEYSTQDSLSVPHSPGTATRPGIGQRWLSSLSNAQPALKRSSSVLHSRAKSIAALVPKLNTAPSDAELVEEQRDQQWPQRPNKVFGDLFNGESAPVRLGVPSPTKEEVDDNMFLEYRPALTERPAGPKRRSTAQSTSSTGSTGNKLSWFSRRSAGGTTAPIHAHDELLTINIQNALLPYGQADSLSPHAFNDLLLNATTLIQRMQAAYKDKVDYIVSVQPEMDVQREEVEEATTRSEHLKMQLEEMSRRFKDQEEAMREMSLALTEERMRRQELQEAAASTVKLVRCDSDESCVHRSNGAPIRRKRSSGGSASDSGFESDLDPDTASTRSMASARQGRALPPTPSMSSIDQRLRLPLGSQDRTGSGNSITGLDAWSRSSSFDRRISARGRAGAGTGGADGEAAWATVEALRGENVNLRNDNSDMRRRMAEMQTTLQGCIEFVSELRI